MHTSVYLIGDFKGDKNYKPTLAHDSEQHQVKVAEEEMHNRFQSSWSLQVISPLNLNLAPYRHWWQIVKRLWTLTSCDTAYVLHGYQASKDARTELKAARLFGLQVIFQDLIDPEKQDKI